MDLQDEAFDLRCRSLRWPLVASTLVCYLTSKIGSTFLKADMVVQQHINLVHPDDDLSLKDEFVYLRHHVLFFMTDILLSVNRRAKLALELFRV